MDLLLSRLCFHGIYVSIEIGGLIVRMRNNMWIPTSRSKKDFFVHALVTSWMREQMKKRKKKTENRKKSVVQIVSNMKWMLSIGWNGNSQNEKLQIKSVVYVKLLIRQTECALLMGARCFHGFLEFQSIHFTLFQLFCLCVVVSLTATDSSFFLFLQPMIDGCFLWLRSPPATWIQPPCIHSI